MKLFAKQKQNHRPREGNYGYQEGKEEKQLLYVKQITNKTYCVAP